MRSLLVGMAVVVMVGACARGQVVAPAERKPFKQEIPKAAFAVEMVPVVGDEARGIKPFYIGKTELTWDAFDVFAYGLDAEGGEEVDAVTRPSKPYLPPDRGFGHEGFAAITVSHASATAFCEWLSARSGRRFRLATEDEWELACGGAPEDVDAAVWHAGNAEDKPHRVGMKKANALGVHDMLGNVAEWVNGRDGKPVVKGGSYRDSAESISCAGREVSSRAWNDSDPQIPRSRWWLADAPFIGFRVVCEVQAERVEGKTGEERK